MRKWEGEILNASRRHNEITSLISLILRHKRTKLPSFQRGNSFHKGSNQMFKPEDHWSCIAHLIAEDVLKSAVIEEKTFKHSPWARADNPLGPKF